MKKKVRKKGKKKRRTNVPKLNGQTITGMQERDGKDGQEKVTRYIKKRKGRKRRQGEKEEKKKGDTRKRNGK